MKEMITQSQAETVLRIIAIVSPIAGLLMGLLCKRALAGLAAGLAGTGIYGLWRVYTAFGDRYGYSSVASLAVQLGIFVGIGIVIGSVARRSMRRGRRPEMAPVGGPESPRHQRHRDQKEERLHAG